MLSKILNFIGIVLMIGVIVLAFPVTVPKLFGYQIYHVLTESMEPEYPPGTAIYVKHVEFSEISEGDIITFRMGSKTDLPATHRVARVDEANQQFITKGDANISEDITPVSYERVIGKVVLGIPFLGSMVNSLQTPLGLGCCIGIFFLTLILWEVAAKIKLKESKKR